MRPSHPAIEALARRVRHLRARLLYARHARFLLLDPALFAGRSVLLLGPARTLQDDLADFPLGDFDMVVKMNNGLHLPVTERGAEAWRCDVLFHSLTANARPVTPADLARAGVRVLVHRTTGRGRAPLTLEAVRRLAPVPVRILPPARYAALSARLGGASPTTGLVALDLLLGCDTARLAVAGLTFFATRYLPGYDDRDRTDASSRARVRAEGHHDPDAERRLLRDAFAEAARRGRRIDLGPHVRAALEAAP
jgi:hypothetical protein